MLGKIGSLFKKSENDWMKVTVSIIISAVMVMFFSKTVVSSYAIPNTLPNTLTSGMGSNSERITLFEELNGSEQLNLVPYYATDGSGIKYTVYCLDKEKEWANGYTITKDSAPLDSGYVYLIQNGYPAKSLTGNNAYDDYLTQIAVWWYQDLAEGTNNLTTNQKNVIERSEYYKYIEPLINGAVNAKNNPVTINPSFSINSSNFKLSSDNKYLITDTITVNSNVTFDNYSVTVNNSAVDVLDSNNNPVTGTINSGSGFKLRVNLANIDSPITVNISVTVNYTEYQAYSYTPSSDIVQNALPAALVPTSKQKTISNNVSMPTGSLTIKKVDGSDNPLAGATIEVRRVINDEVIANFETTTSDYTISNLLPGEYKINELSAPSGYNISEASKDIIINTTNLNPSVTIRNTKNDVRVRKIDSTTNEAVAGAVLRILDSNNEEVYRFTSTTDYVSIPNLSEGTYKIEEVSAPAGYVLNTEEKEFTVNSSNPSITVDFENEPNEIIIEKRDASDNSFVSGAGLRLVRVSDNRTIDEWTSNNSGHTIRGLEPGDYKVIETSAPDGYTISSSEVNFTVTNTQTEPLTVTFYNSNNQVSVVKKDSETNEIVSGATLQITDSSDQVIDTFTTTDSSHVLSKLDPGTYYVKETKAPDGYVLDDSTVSFEINDNTNNLQVEFKNKKNEVRLAKVDSDTNNYVAGARLRLTDSGGDEIETFTSGSEPHVIRGLASGTYYLEELEAPDGYIRNTERVTVTIKDTDDVVTYTIANKKTGVNISKVDSETGDIISGVTLEILDSNKDTIKTITTTDSPTSLNDLGAGTYYVRETRAARGYVLDKSLHEFTISEDNPDVSVVIENEPIVLRLGKIDANTGDYISGALMRLTREDGTMDPIEFVSTNDAYVVSRIPAGIYSLSEIEPPEGYISSSSKVVFEVLETGEVQTMNISSDVITVTINGNRVEIDSNGVSGYKFELKDSEGNIIEEITTTEDVYTSGELALGDYRLVQTDAPSGVVVNGDTYYFSITDSNTVSVVNFVNDFTKVMVSKKDITNSEEIAGAHLVIRNDNEEAVAEWTSTDTPHYIEKLPVGHYSLTETLAPSGYVLNPATVEFDVLPNGEIQSVVMINSKPIEVPNTGSNATYIYLIGGLLIIIGGTLMYISYRNKNNKKSIKNI